MKQFVKYVCATIVGIFLTGVIISILSIFSLVGLASMGNAAATVQDNSVLVVPISALTLNSANKVTMRETFAQAGMAGVKEAVEGTLGMKIDNYATLSNDAFERVCDIYGGITYMATEELYYISKDNDENDITIMKGEMSTLSGRQIRLLTQYPVFSKGKQGNNEFLGEAMESLINNMFLHSNITSDNLDNLYNIITTNSDTDMNMDDFKLQKSYIKDMLSEGIVPAEKLVPEGVWADKDENFTISEDFITKLKEKAAETTPELGGGTAIEKTPVQDSAAAGRVIVE